MAVLMLGVPMGIGALLPPGLFALDTAGPEDTRRVFHWKDGLWTPTPPFPGGLYGLRVSAKGAVWSIANRRGGLCRLDGDHWTYFGGQQFGTPTDWLPGGFALRGEEVWAAGADGAVQFDGRSWHLYPDALKTPRPTDIVAGSSGVWIVDEDGNLSHFDGSGWTTQSLAGVVPAEPPPGQSEGDDDPRLAMTADGRVWVSWRGLWRQDGDSWREVRSPGLNLAEALPVGQDAENVWLLLFRTNEIAEMTPEGRVAAHHGWREMGVPKSADFGRLAASNGQIWTPSSSGLLAFGGGRWTNRGLPPGCTTLTNVALAPDRSVWVLGDNRPLPPGGQFFGLPIRTDEVVMIVIGLAIWVYFPWLWRAAASVTWRK
jgi:hypothetical protein